MDVSTSRFSTRFKSIWIFTLAVAFALSGTSSSALADDLSAWLQKQKQNSIERMMRNVSPAGTRPGAVIASPERNSPNYFYHWVRDSAVTMDTIVTLYEKSSGKEKQLYRQRLMEFVDFSRTLQQTNSPAGMGEARFNVDGTVNPEPWCAPQNDGPGLRAVALSRFALILIREGKADYVREKLYDGKIPTYSVIKADLEFVSHHWRAENCDLWEEIFGDHFYTRMAQRRGLIEGAKLARALGDGSAATWYESQARALEPEIEKHWNSGKGYFLSTVNRTGGIDWKQSQIDAAVVMALLHGSARDSFIPFHDPRMLSTAEKTREAFRNLYSINQRPEFAGVAIGRYPEDRYAGTNFDGGNPWVLLTAGFANYEYEVAAHFMSQGNKKVAQVHIQRGDDYMRRVRAHANPDGSLSEQIDRYTGFMTSARELTWSHVEVIQAIWARERLGLR